MKTVVVKTRQPSPQAVPFVTLNNGLRMPQLGLGTYNQGSNETAYRSMLAALRAGYRKVDTAHLYNDEEGWDEPSTSSWKRAERRATPFG